jgi:hypothetical protein
MIKGWGWSNTEIVMEIPSAGDSAAHECKRDLE